MTEQDQKKLLVVFGATGTQGGSVIKALQADPVTAREWRIRGITRDTSKPSAQALREKGVETVTGDLNDKDSLRDAFKGAYAVYAVTNYWENVDGDAEEQQGRNVADAAKEAGVQHLVWSSLINVTELSKGKYKRVYHFDSKAHVEDYIRASGVPATFMLAGFYMSNLPNMGMIRQERGSAGHELVFSLPVPEDTPIPLFDADADAGKFVKAILKKREQTLGRRVLAATAYYTPREVLETLRRVKPNKGGSAHFAQPTPEQYTAGLQQTGLSEKAAIELLENMQFMPEFGYFGGEPLEPSLELLEEKPTTWEEFVRKTPAWKDLD